MEKELHIFFSKKNKNQTMLLFIYWYMLVQRMNLMQYSSNHRSESPLSSESSMIIESMSRACRYSPEEKQVRIQRYRTKRNQRNFNKKIKVNYLNYILANLFN